MKVSAFLVIALGATALPGCVVPDHHHRPRAAKVVVPVPAVVVPVPAAAKHCPPGQAKKGNC